MKDEHTISKRFRSKRRNEDDRSSPTENEVDSRRQRSTMFLLANEQQLAAKSQLPGSKNMATGKPVSAQSIKQRLETLLATPEEHIFTLPDVELNALVLSVAGLYQEQERLYSGYKAQLM